MKVARAWEEEGLLLVFDGYRVSVQVDGKVLWMVAQHCEYILIPLNHTLKNCLNGKFQDFPSGPVVKTPHFQCRRLWVLSLIGSQNPTGHVPWPKILKINGKFYVMYILLQFLKTGGIPWQSNGQNSILSLPRTLARSLVGVLRSHKPCDTAKKKTIIIPKILYEYRIVSLNQDKWHCVGNQSLFQKVQYA